MLQIETTADLNSLLADTTTWDSLTRGVPFRTTTWLGSWWNCFGGAQEPYVLVARDERGDVRGTLPLYRRASAPRTLAFIGDGTACSDYVSILAREEDASAVSAAMANHLLTCAGSTDEGWDILEIDGVVDGDESMKLFARTFDAGGAIIHGQSRMSTWRRPAAESWDDHLATHGKSQRRKIRALVKKLQNNESLRQWHAETPEQMHRLLDHLIELHQRRWMAAGEPGSFAMPEFREFVRQLSARFLETGNLYLSALERDGVVIGVELNIVGDDRILYSYSSGFDLDHADVEPGRVLGVDTLQSLYQNQLVAIDYMRGDEEYKQRFASESHRVYQLRVTAPTWLPRLRNAIWTTQFELKQFARRQTGRDPIVIVDVTGGKPTLPVASR